MDAAPLPESPHPPKQAKNEKIRKLAVHAAGVTSSRIAVVLSPDTGMAEAAPKILPLSDW